MDLDGGRRERAVCDTGQMTTDRISSVQLVRFPVGPIGRGGLLALAEAGKLAIEVDHASLAARGPLSAIQRAPSRRPRGLTLRRRKQSLGSEPKIRGQLVNLLIIAG
jgi:hypothetical protein